MGGDELPVDVRFGTLDLTLTTFCSVCSPPSYPAQGWVLPIHSAAGRYSVGLNAVALDDDCDP